MPRFRRVRWNVCILLSIWSMATLRRTLGPPSVVEIYAIKSEELWSWHCNDGITSTVIFDERDVVVWTMATATVVEAGP